MTSRIILAGVVAVEAAFVAAYQISSWQELAAFSAAIVGLLTLARYALRGIRKLSRVHDAVEDTAARSKRMEEAMWLLIDGRIDAAKDTLAGRSISIGRNDHA